MTILWISRFQELCSILQRSVVQLDNMLGWRAKETRGGHAFCRNPSKGFVLGFAGGTGAVDRAWRHGLNRPS
jgi:hypothetical protein